MSEDITDQRFTDEAALRYFRRHFPGYDVEAPAAPGGQWRAAATWPEGHRGGTGVDPVIAGTALR